MPSQTIKVLRVDAPGNSLAAWLAGHHPDLFLTVLKQAQVAQTAQKVKLGGLGDGLPSSDVTPGLQEITFDSSALVPAKFVTDATDTGSSWLSNLGSALTSSGSSIGSTLLGAGSSVLGALGSVGSYLTSPVGLNNLTGLAKTYFTLQGQTSNAQTQQAVLQAQTQRAMAGQTAAPITYQRDAYGNMVPVYATQTPQGSVYQPLSRQGISNLAPSSISVFLSQYGLWLGLGGLALLGLYLRSRR